MGDYDCDRNNITTLKGIPKELEYNLWCDDNPNPNLIDEWNFRKENPNMTEDEIKEKMFELTGDDDYLSDEAKDIFLF